MIFTQEDQLNYINQEIKILNLKEEIVHTWQNYPIKPSLWNHQDPLKNNTATDQNVHCFNTYADKQLTHLVVSEEFDFEKIASILNIAFANDKLTFTERSCRQRWTELELMKNRKREVLEKKMEDKRATSISNMSNPYSLYNVEEMLQKLEQGERIKNKHLLKQNVNLCNGQNGQVNPCNGHNGQVNFSNMLNLSEQSKNEVKAVDEVKSVEQISSEQQYKGYNIFKDSIRTIDDMQSYTKLQAEMREALRQAQQPNNIVTDKLMHYTPFYQQLNHFQVNQEELTQEKMNEIMAYPIQFENIDQELSTPVNQKDYSSKISQQVKKSNQMKGEFDIEEDWDQYESD